MKPPCAEWKLPQWNDIDAITMIASSGTAVFQITTIELLSAMKCAPARFIRVNKIIAIVATTRPNPFNSPALEPLWWIMLKFSCTQVRLFAYAIAASTSIGAIRTACSQDDHPATKPASGPWEKYGNRPVPPATGYVAPSSA